MHQTSATYKIYGLNIASAISLAAPVSNELPDIEIAFGKIAYPPDTWISKGACFYARKDELFFEIKDVARYHVQSGKRIIIEPFQNADLDDIRLFLNGPVLGSLLLQKGLLPLHASAFEFNKKAILIAGNSGAGKSSLLAYLSEKNYPVIADDIASIELKKNDLMVHSAGNHLKLWKDTMQKLDLNPDNLKKVRLKLEKFLYPVEFSKANEWSIEKVFILKTHNRKEVVLKELKGIEKFTAIKEYTYRKAFLKGMEIEKTYFSLIIQIAMQIPICEVYRPNAGFEMELLSGKILENLTNG